MEAAELGKRIKEARLAKKMTQSEVVGDFITRNMLSQIESGAAMPSVKTLSYLARVLSLPAEQMLSADSPPDEAYQLLQDAKAALRASQYAEVPQDTAQFPPAIADELYALAARASFLAAQDCFQAEQSQQAAALCQRAIDCAAQGLYANEALRQEAAALLKQSAEKLREYYEKLSNHA